MHIHTVWNRSPELFDTQTQLPSFAPLQAPGGQLSILFQWAVFFRCLVRVSLWLSYLIQVSLRLNHAVICNGISFLLNSIPIAFMSNSVYRLVDIWLHTPVSYCKCTAMPYALCLPIFWMYAWTGTVESFNCYIFNVLRKCLSIFHIYNSIRSI